MFDDVTVLARLQFAFTMSFHFLFPALTVLMLGAIRQRRDWRLRTPAIASRRPTLCTEARCVDFTLADS